MIDRDLLRRRWDEDLERRLREGGDGAFPEVLSEVAGLVVPGARFGPEGRASAVTVQGSGIFGGRADDWVSHAGLSGAVRPAGLVFADLRVFNVQEWRDPNHQGTSRPRGGVSVNRRRETDLFRGLFMAFDLETAVRGTTFVEPHRVGPGIADRDALERVSTGDAAFERTFRVMSSDADEARDLLLPSVRGGLLRLAETVKQPLHVSIAEARACLAIELPSLFDGQRADFDHLARIADLFALVDLAAAALPVGVALPEAHRPPGPEGRGEPAPGRPARSQTRLSRRGDTLSITYTKAASPLALWLSALSAPLLAWLWFLAVRAVLTATGDNTGAMATMIPLAVASLLWLYAGQQWWTPVTRVDVAGGELRVVRGRLRTTRVTASSVRSLAVRKGVLYGDALALSPSLPGDELRWLAHEVGQALPAAKLATG